MRVGKCQRPRLTAPSTDGSWPWGGGRRVEDGWVGGWGVLGGGKCGNGGGYAQRRHGQLLIIKTLTSLIENVSGRPVSREKPLQS